MLSLVGTLKYFGFGQHMVDLTMLLYNYFEACTTDMGHSSHWFKPTRGFHQECPASTGYFILIAELLGQSIRNNDNIKGIKINGLEYKSGQFADDTILFSMYDQDSLQTIIDSLVFFENNTGLKLNYDKSAVCRIGSLRNSNAKLYTTKEVNWESKDLSV